METNQVELTTRHWKLYNLLRKYSNFWMTQWKIYNVLKEYYPEIGEVNEKNFHDSFARQRMSRDIVDLNNSDKIQKIILSSSNGLKIATREEYVQWSNRKWMSLKRMIKRLSVKDDKFKLDGQFKILFSEDTKARNYHETFTKSVDKIDEKE